MNYIVEFEKVLKSTIFPLVKKDGFKRQGFHFCKSVNDIFWVFNFQKSRYNHKKSCSFFINLGVFYPPIHEELCSRLSTNFPKEYDCQLRKRIGKVKGDLSEDQYVISSKKQLKSIGHILINDYNQFIIPFFEKFNSLHDLKDYLETTDNLHDYYLLLFLNKQNKSEFNRIKLKMKSHKDFNYQGNKYWTWKQKIDELEDKFIVKN